MKRYVLLRLLRPYSYSILRQTSALDAHTESELMRNINTILLDKARTSIFIAHRLRTVVESGLLPSMHIRLNSVNGDLSM